MEPVMQKQQVQEQQNLVKPQTPVELDFAQLQLVSGGAPKSGWGALDSVEMSALDSTSAPKSGW